MREHHPKEVDAATMLIKTNCVEQFGLNVLQRQSTQV